MQELFFTSNKPRHLYKSGKFFTNYLRLRDQSNFGQLLGRQESLFKKMLVLKKFFCWYYGLENKRHWAKVYNRTFAKKRLTFRALTNFFHLLESNVLIVLVRAGFAVDFKDAVAQVKSGCIFVNGSLIQTNFFILRPGDIFESFRSSLQYIVWYKPLFFLVRNFTLFRLTYFVQFVTLLHLSGKLSCQNQFREFRQNAKKLVRKLFISRALFQQTYLVKRSRFICRKKKSITGPGLTGYFIQASVCRLPRKFGLPKGENSVKNHDVI